VANDEAEFDRVLAAHNMHVGAADGRKRDANHRFPNPGLRTGNFFNPNFIYSVKYESFHLYL
jgi:hypothetical protein